MKLYGNLDLRKSGFHSRVTPGVSTANTVFTLAPADGTAGTILDSGHVTGDITFNSSSVSAIAAGVIVNADINASAAIAFSKLASLSTGQIIAGNGGVATAVTVSGDVTISAAGDVQIAAGSIVNADVNASAAIAYSKLAALATGFALQSNASTGFIEVSGVSNTELSYLVGVTSSIQSQLNAITGGIDWKQSVRAATTASITLSGAQTIDTVSVVAGDRVLVKNQGGTASNLANGIYVVAAGAWSRAADADASSEVTAGMTCFVSEGSANLDSVWQLITDDPITLGTTALEFVKIANFGDHGTLSGLGDDDHTQYALLAGRSGGQTLNGGTAAGNNLILSSTSNATKGTVDVTGSNIRMLSGTSAAELQLYEPSGSGTNYTAFKAQAQAGDVTYTLPAADAAVSGYVLSSNASGTLSWVSNASSASSSTTIAAAAASPQVVNHALASTDVMVQIFEVTSGETIEVDTVVRTDANNVTLTFSEAVPSGGWRVMVLKM